MYMLARWSLALLALLSSPAFATEPTLCRALDALRTEAEQSGPQRVTIYKQEEMTFACGRTASVRAQDAFCTAAAAPVGVEFTHVFPWLVYDCLRAEHVSPTLTRLDQYTGISRRKKISRLSAMWRGGTRLDISFMPTGDFGDDPKFKDYWGNYKLVIWRP